MKLQLAAVLALLGTLSMGSKLESDVSLYQNYEESASPINMRTDCYNGKCYDYYYMQYYYRSYYGNDTASNFFWLLILLICGPIYCCLRCGGCIKNSNHSESSTTDDHYKSADSTSINTNTGVTQVQYGQPQPQYYQAQPGMMDPNAAMMQQQQM